MSINKNLAGAGRTLRSANYICCSYKFMIAGSNPATST